MWYLLAGVESGDIRLRGRLENGDRIMDITTRIQHHATSDVQDRSPLEAVMDIKGRVYVDLLLNKSDLKKFVKAKVKQSDWAS